MSTKHYLCLLFIIIHRSFVYMNSFLHFLSYIFSIFYCYRRRFSIETLKNIGNRTVTTDALFDISVSSSVQRFTTKGQFRASKLYKKISDNYLIYFHIRTKASYCHAKPTLEYCSQFCYKIIIFSCPFILNWTSYQQENSQN